MRRSKSRPLSLAAASLALATSLSSQGNVIVVDQAGGPGSDFTSIQPAINAADSGDLILVREGGYFDVIVNNGKSLTIEAEEDAQVSVFQIIVSGLPAGETVKIRGIDPDQPFAFAAQIEITNNQGNVWIEDVIAPDTQIGGGTLIVNSDSVVLSRVSQHAGFTGLVLSVVESTVLLSDVETGTDVPKQAGLDVGDGARVFVSGGRFEGGPGQNAHQNPGSCIPADPGSPAIEVDGVGAEVFLLDPELVGGAGGTGVSAQCPDAPDGDPFVVLEGTVTELARSHRAMAVDSPVRVGQTATLTLEGQPGDLAWLFYAPDPMAGMAAKAWDGWSVLDPPLSRIFLGVVPSSGVLTFSGTIAPIGTPFISFVSQAFLFEPGGRWIATSPSSVTLLEPLP